MMETVSSLPPRAEIHADIVRLEAVIPNMLKGTAG